MSQIVQHVADLLTGASSSFLHGLVHVLPCFFHCMVDHQWKVSPVLLSEAKKERESFCLTSTGTKLFIRDGDKEGRGRNSEGSIAGTNSEDQDAVDRRQNKNVKAVSLALA